MLSADVHAQIRRLWDTLWSGGIANPLTAIEQITYLLFLRRIEEIDRRRGGAQRSGQLPAGSIFTSPDDPSRWSVIRRQPPEKMFELVRDHAFPFLKRPETAEALNGAQAFAVAMHDAVFLIPKPYLLKTAVDTIDELDLGSIDNDVQGDIYEELLSELSLSGKNGQFRTPRHLIAAIVQLMAPRPGERICDPAAGTAGFLVAAHQHTQQHRLAAPLVSSAPKKSRARISQTEASINPTYHEGALFGHDFDITMVRLGLMNMILHGIQNPQFYYQDSLSRTFDPPKNITLVLANPPFAGNVDEQDVNRDILTLQTSRTDLLFVELCLTILADGGRCAIIVPDSVLFSSSSAHVELRRRMLDQYRIDGIVSLPSGLFKPYTGVKSAILLLARSQPARSIWYYQVTADGYSLDDRRVPTPANNDLQYLPEAFAHRGEDPNHVRWSSPHVGEVVRRQSWTADRRQIAEQDDVLTPALYQPHDTTARTVQAPKDILARVRQSQAEINAGILRIEALLGGEDGV